VKKVLFVCLGNICRSPTAEAVFRSFLEKKGLADQFATDSAGILSVHQGEPADPRMRQHAAKRGYDLTSTSRQVRPSDFAEFEWVIAMDGSNETDLVKVAPDAVSKEKIFRMMEFHPDQFPPDVPDPYYGGAQGFETVLDLVEEACEGLLEQIRS